MCVLYCFLLQMLFLFILTGNKINSSNFKCFRHLTWPILTDNCLGMLLLFIFFQAGTETCVTAFSAVYPPQEIQK